VLLIIRPQDGGRTCTGAEAAEAVGLGERLMRWGVEATTRPIGRTTGKTRRVSYCGGEERVFIKTCLIMWGCLMGLGR